MAESFTVQVYQTAVTGHVLTLLSAIMSYNHHRVFQTKAAYVLVYKRRGVESPPQTIPTKLRQASETSTSNTSNGEGGDINGFNNSEDEMDTN